MTIFLITVLNFRKWCGWLKVLQTIKNEIVANLVCEWIIYESLIESNESSAWCSANHPVTKISQKKREKNPNNDDPSKNLKDAQRIYIISTTEYRSIDLSTSKPAYDDDITYDEDDPDNNNSEFITVSIAFGNSVSYWSDWSIFDLESKYSS